MVCDEYTTNLPENLSYFVNTFGEELRVTHPAAEPPEIPSRYAAVHAAKLAIDSDFTSERSIPEYARDAAMSESSFRRLFAEYTGTPPARYRQKLQLEYVKLLVQSGECNLSEAASRAGYNSLPYLCRQFRREYGRSFSEFMEDERKDRQ